MWSAPGRTRPGWRGYTSEDAFHEVFVLLGYLAAVTSSVELVTGVLILPQRQTALVAKQAAEVDLLSAGRLRLGVGVGWNPVEYEVLGEDFTTRGARSAEQIRLLRELWANPLIDFDGEWHTVHDAGSTLFRLGRSRSGSGARPKPCFAGWATGRRLVPATAAGRESGCPDRPDP